MFGELKKRIQHGYSHLPRRLFRGAPRGNGRTQTGASLIEFMVALPAFLALGLGTFQTIMVYNAKTVLDYATFEAARTGAVTHAQSHKMRDTLGMRLAPIYGGDGTPEKAMAAITQGILEARDTGYTTIEVLNPTREAFDDFGQTNPETGRIEIPNSHLRYAPRDIGATSGVNLQDANLLKIKVTYGYKLDVPFIDRLVTGTLQRLDPQNAAYYRIGRIPLTAVATVRMQSEAWPGGNVSVASAGGGGAVGDPGNDSGTGGGATGNPGDGTGSNGGQGTGSNDGGNPSGGNTGGNPTGGTGPAPRTIR